MHTFLWNAPYWLLLHHTLLALTMFPACCGKIANLSIAIAAHLTNFKESNGVVNVGTIEIKKR
jgi:hypothetical protein